MTLPEAAARLQESLDAFDADVADHLENETERADLWHDMDANAEDIRTVLAALSLRSDAHTSGEVKVKPLEWSSEPPYSVARVFRGHYATEWVEETRTCELRGTFMRGDFATVAEAKTAAQANHERHVLACLSIGHPIQGEVKASTVFQAVRPFLAATVSHADVVGAIEDVLYSGPLPSENAEPPALESLERYEQFTDGWGDEVIGLKQHPKGEYVKFADVAALFACQPPTPAGVREITEEESVERAVRAMGNKSHLSLRAQVRAALAAAKGAGE